MEESMVKMMDKLPELLNQLGEKLGVASAKIWEWALLDVKVQMWQGALFTVGFILFLLVGYVAIKYVNKRCKDDDNYDCNGWLIFGFIWAIAAFVGCVETILFISKLPSLIINPEWTAFQNIMKQLSELK